MRDLLRFQKWLFVVRGYPTGDSHNGAFRIPARDLQGAQPHWRHILFVVASTHDGWEHVSVSLRTREHKIIAKSPTWEQMAAIHRLFFGDEPVMQVHAPETDHINHHPWCRHLWRPTDAEIPLPPIELLGPETSQPQGGRPHDPRW